MTQVEQKEQPGEKKGARNLRQSDLAMPFFVFSGFGAGYITAVTAIAAAYDSQNHSLAGLLTHYAFGLIFLPCYFVALLHNRWTSIPLWVCALLLVVPSFFHTPTAAGGGIGALQPGIGIFITPALVEAARYLRAKHSKE